MKKLLEHSALFIGLAFLVNLLIAIPIYAEETNIDYGESIEVAIQNDEGIKILVKDGEILYSNSALGFYLNSSETLIDGDIEYERFLYSISNDGGESYNEKNELPGNEYRLSPNKSGEEYYIKFFKEIRVKKIIEIVEEIPKEETSEEEILDEEISEEEIKNQDSMEDDLGENDIEDDATLVIRKEEIITNIYESSKAFHIIFDLDAPEVFNESEQILNNWVNTPISAHFKLLDDLSGISRVVIASNNKVYYEYHQGAGKENEIAIDTLLDEEANSEGGVGFTVYASDISGNAVTKEFTYYLDLSAPKLECIIPASGLISNKDAEVCISAADSIMSTTRLSVTIVKKNRGNQIIYLDKLFENSENGISFRDVIGEDGEYYLTAMAMDQAGNESEIITSSFRIDKTAPKIDLSGFEYGKDYRNNVNVNVRAIDEFYNDSLVRIKIIKSLPNSTAVYLDDSSVPLYECFERNILLSDDGDYSILIEMEDRAGNHSSLERNVRVDKTAPLLNISGITDKQIIKGMPNILVSLNELFYDSASLSIEGFIKNNYGVYEQVLNDSYSMRNEYFETPYAINREGEYLINLRAVDRAGNEAVKSLEFTYDCTSPFIGWLHQFDKKYITKLIFPRGFRDNIEDLTSVSYMAFLNARNLDEGTIINEDGKYILRVIACDAAGNISDDAIEFIVDNTPPKVVARGINSSGSVRVGDTVEFSLYDKEDVFTKITYLGKEVDTIDEGKRCRIVIKEEGKQEIALYAADLAGNETEKIILLNASVFAMPENVTNAIKSITRGGNEAIINNPSLIIDKNNEQKSPLILISFILGLLGVFIALKVINSRIDTTK